MAEIIGLLKKPSFLIKFLELVLAIVAVIILQDSTAVIKLGWYRMYHRIALVYMVYCGYVLITPMHIIGRFMDEKTPKTVAMAWAFTGCILWLTAGGMLLHSNELGLPFPLPQKYEDEILATGILGIINGFLFFGEITLIFKYE